MKAWSSWCVPFVLGIAYTLAKGSQEESSTAWNSGRIQLIAQAPFKSGLARQKKHGVDRALCWYRISAEVSASYSPDACLAVSLLFLISRRSLFAVVSEANVEERLKRSACCHEEEEVRKDLLSGSHASRRRAYHLTKSYQNKSVE